MVAHCLWICLSSPWTSSILNDQVVAAAGVDRVDVAIDNVRYLERYDFTADNDPEKWWRGREVNMHGTIVNLNNAGAVGLLPRYSPYSILKLAILRFAEWINVEHDDMDVLAYSIHSGVI
ncbi:uncharacterized protein PHACADRAFT_211385, partial [Phanerochaete carnosa HHB-10118-sp]